MHLKWVIIYLDDIVIFSKTPKEHIQRLRGIFQKLHEAGLKLKPKKCEFCKTRISYLGHIVSQDGIECDPKKIEAIKNWKRPITVHDVRSFLGFTNYYRRFIHKYAQVANPLNKKKMVPKSKGRSIEMKSVKKLFKLLNLNNYTFSINYKSGKTNVDVDALSRNPWDMQVDTAIVKSIINEERSTQTPLYESYGPNTNLLHPEVVIAKGGYVTRIVPPELETAKTTTMTREEWIPAQKQDPVLNQLVTLIKSKTLGHRKHHTNDSSELKSMLRIKNQLILRKGL